MRNLFKSKPKAKPHVEICKWIKMEFERESDNVVMVRIYKAIYDNGRMIDKLTDEFEIKVGDSIDLDWKLKVDKEEISKIFEKLE